MSESLDAFYLIVGDVDELADLVPLGVKLIQLRIKNRDERYVYRQIVLAKEICEQYECQLVVNDYWQMAIDTKCDFVHLGQEDLNTADVEAIARAGISLGISSHDESELAAALAVKPAYVALGPVYKTILKEMPWAPQGLERVAEWKRRLGSTPLVGIGGISLQRGAGVLAAGADSVAVVTDVSLHADPRERVRAWLRATR
ncbi:MAG: thiamine phosphate synthase [Kofleriaceae bacterium]|nr:thiamine phosphate synthase [Kofleriaceae bacterium]